MPSSRVGRSPGLGFAAVRSLFALIAASVVAAEQQFIQGTLLDRLTSDAGARAVIELRLSTDRALPGVGADARVYRANTPQFRPDRARAGLAVAFVDGPGGQSLFVDANLDGRLTSAEHHAIRANDDTDLEVQLPPARPGGYPVPFRCRVAIEMGGRRMLAFTAAFRVHGYADIGGQRTLVSLPFNVGTGEATAQFGKIGIDANGDGVVDLDGFSGPEVMWAQGERVILKVRDRYVSVESVDANARTFRLREHAAGEYVYTPITLGERMPAFDFTDFDGRPRSLTEFRGRYLLIDFWGTWCGPCIAELPNLAVARDRFAGRGFEVLGINYEKGATIERVRDFLAERRIGWPNATSASVKDLVERRLRILAFPTKVLLDREGRVIEMRDSALSGEALLRILSRLLESRPFRGG